MFVFLLLSLVVVVAAVTLAVVGSGARPGEEARGAVGGLAEAPPDLLDEPLPPERSVTHGDVAGLRLAVGVRGYRMEQVDDVLDRLGAELAERDARIAELESALAGAQAVAMGRAEEGRPEPGRAPDAAQEAGPEAREEEDGPRSGSRTRPEEEGR
ncbi:DivIVA domain-containing protein [Streptomyces sp. NPDC006925]|uniref:DivIVA domain-containing protein n=1 Tax=Streptomyces sp. NPDC006925 TaxID=3364768 RepID=UPI0036B17DE7